MKSLTYATVLTLALVPGYAFSQAHTGHSMSDDELTKLALSAAPALDFFDRRIAPIGIRVHWPGGPAQKIACAMTAP